MMFEYKVKAKHKLGYKEFKFYADTDIEEFLNRNNIKYVRNITDTIEHRQQEEIERLNKIINKAIEAINVYQDKKTLSVGYQDLKRIRGILQGNEFDLQMFEEYLQELKGVDKE